MLNRRSLMIAGTRMAAGALLAPASRAFAADAPIVLRRAAEEPIPLPQDFIGLGYEMSSVARIGLLSPANERYLRLVRQLGPRGVLRVGGIVADYTRYEANGTPAAGPKETVITHAALEQFAAFLKETRWTAIWSLNFAQASLPEAVVEAKAVATALGPHLQAFECGNEVENYGHGSRPFRACPYSYEKFRAEYSSWHAEILKAVPNARFAGPDTAESVAWVEQMAADSHGDVQLLTTHYYRNNQKQGSAEQLNQPDPKLAAKLDRLRKAAQQSGIPWRMCETNSFSGGGLPGVSDTLTGALWTLDFMLLLARFGCSGVNIETGVNQLGFVSSYSPIQDDGKGNNTAGVPYYGMLAFARARAGCSHSIAVDVPGQSRGLTAYALGVGKEAKAAVLVNRGSSEVQVSLAELGLRRASVQRLIGPAIDSRHDVTFAGAAVAADGQWKPTRSETVQEARLLLPAASAAVLQRH